MSAYFLFLNDIREELKKENPKAGVADISKMAGYVISIFISENVGQK